MPSTDNHIRPMLKRDLDQVLAWRNHPRVRQFMYSQHEISPTEHIQWFEESQQDPHKYLLIFEAGEKAMGFVNLEVGRCHVADWGFYTAPNALQGTGNLLANAALNHAFSKIGLHKICGQALAFNKSSIKLHRKLGFKHEGTLREQYFDGNTYHDVMCFGLLSQEWKPKP